MTTWVSALPLEYLTAPHEDEANRAHRSSPHERAASAPVRTHASLSPLSVADQEIVARLRTGDATLYSALFEHYWAPLCDVVAFSGHNADDAREIVADVFASLWLRRATWTVTTSVEAYLFGAARRRAARAYRDRVHRKALLAKQLPEDWESVSLDGQRTEQLGSTDEIDRRLTIEQIIDTLPERSRLALYLRWYRALEFHEVGEILGISAEAARKLATRALEVLKERVRRDG